MPVADFAHVMAKDSRIGEFLDRDLAEKHGMDWRQQFWEDNKSSVATHTEALIAAEMDNPLRTGSSIEAAALVELVFPGVEEMTLPAEFAGRLPSEEVKQRLGAVWPELLAALLDTVRADRAVDWSAAGDGRLWDGESPLYGRWATRRKNGWTARRFIGNDERGSTCFNFDSGSFKWCCVRRDPRNPSLVPYWKRRSIKCMRLLTDNGGYGLGQRHITK
jgi:hypothetical protein